MQFQRFDLNLLIALDTLLREKNITRAAEKVFVSQPAMSAALHRLRDFFGDPLLVRVGRDMELSARGQSLVEPVREALLLIQATLGTQPTFTAATTQREFTLIVSEEAVPSLLPAILRRASAEAPGIRIKFDLVSQASLNRLEYGDADLCLCLDSLRLFEVRSFPDTLSNVQLRPVRWIATIPAWSTASRQNNISPCRMSSADPAGMRRRPNSWCAGSWMSISWCTTRCRACCICRWYCRARAWWRPCPSAFCGCSRKLCT